MSDENAIPEVACCRTQRPGLVGDSVPPPHFAMSFEHPDPCPPAFICSAKANCIDQDVKPLKALVGRGRDGGCRRDECGPGARC